jgi:hypothetical protein
VPDDSLRRTSHALATGDGVYVIDPIEAEGVDERVRALGQPLGVIVLLDRHRRASDAFAERLGVPLHDVPFDGVSGSRFAFPRIVRRRWWREVALWWPERRVLVLADALGSLAYFVAPGEPVGVHPMLRLIPPRRALADLEPEHVLVGHGAGVHGPEAATALRQALASSRRRIPALAGEGVRRLVRR